MSTPKTPLPELYEYIPGVTNKLTQEQKDINQIITYLKEREEEESEAYAQGWNEGQQALKEAQPEKPSLKETTDIWKKEALEISETHEIDKSTTSLKETLLEEMTRMTHDEGEAGSYNVGYNSALSDVEAIINRVFRDNAN